jgi:hypothetical protein
MALLMAQPGALIGPHVLQRLMKRWALASGRGGEVEVKGGGFVEKPQAGSASDLYDEAVLRAGTEPLDPALVKLKVEAWRKYHTCGGCRNEWPAGKGPPCVWPRVEAILRCGWELPPAEEAPKGRVRSWPAARGNHSNCAAFREVVQEKILEQVKEGVLRPLRPDEAAGSVAPALVVLKPGDISRARALTGESLEDSASLQRFNERAKALEAELIKFRLAVDLTASGTNQRLREKPFAMPGVTDLTSKVKPGSRVGALDLRACYHHYPVAALSRLLLRQVDMEGTVYESQYVPFGLGLAPYFASFMIALVREMAAKEGIEIAVYIDDMAVVADTEEECNRQLDRLIGILVELGFTIAPEKIVRATQRIVFLGILIDTVKGTMSIDATKAGYARQTVELFEARLGGAGTDEERLRAVAGDAGLQAMLRALLGKMEWYGSLMQGARGRTQALWDLLLGRTGRGLLPLVMEDLAWWRVRLGAWAEGQDVGGVGSTMLTRSALESGAVVVATDAGDQGVGAAVMVPERPGEETFWAEA